MKRFCYRQGCELEVQYICLCSSCETYSCEFHLEMHLKLPFRSHTFDSVLEEPRQWSKDEVLRFLEKEKSKKSALKNITLTYFRQNFYNPENSIEDSLNKLDSSLEQVNNLIEKISKISEQEQGQISNQISLQPEVKITIEGLESYKCVQLYCRLSQLRKKKYEILSRAKNDPETESEFRSTCSYYENLASDILFNQALQEYINAYKEISSLYLFDIFNSKSKLFIYDTESEQEESKDLKILGKYDITPLPNGELFFCDSLNWSSNSFIFDRNFKTFRELPYGKTWISSSNIYFNRSVYCFGGSSFGYSIRYSIRFDLDNNRWIKLALMPQADHNMSSVIFNGNIVIPGHENSNLFLYTVDTDSFSEINYNNWFSNVKILINGEERLYLIEVDRYGYIYESEIGGLYSWKKIAKSNISCSIDQIQCSYNKGGVFISIIDAKNCRQYFKFDLTQKTLIEVSCYNKRIALRKLGNKLEVIQCYGQSFKLNPDHASAYINKRYYLYDLVKTLEEIERWDEKIRFNPKETDAYVNKGFYLLYLSRNLDAIECYSKAIKLNPKNDSANIGKGDALHNLGRNLEAIEYYNKADPYHSSFGKANALHDLGRYLEAIECYNKLIKLQHWNENIYYEKGHLLYILGKINEALECYTEVITKYSNNKSKYYIGKGNILHELKRDLEAIECYNEAIKLHNDNFMYFCYRAHSLNDLGREVEAVEDFNRAYDLLSIQRSYNHQGHSYEKNETFISEALVQDCIELLKMVCKLEENAVKFKEEIQKLKGESSKNPGILGDIEEEEAKVKFQHSQLLKKAIESLDSCKNMSIEAIKQVECEVTEHQKATIDIFVRLWSSVSPIQ